MSYNGILRTEIFLWASDNFFDSLKLKIRFSSKSVLFSHVDPSMTTKISNWAQAETPNLCQLLELQHNNWEMQTFGWAFHSLWHTKGMKHRLYQKIAFPFPSFAKVRESKSRNEQEQQYHSLVKMSAVIIEML